MDIHLSQEDDKFNSIVTWLNRLALLGCWIAVLTSLVRFIKTNDVLLSLIIAMWVPVRYFFFDITPSKLQKRPRSLDRSIPLTIFVRYLRLRFPIPHGDILASIFGFILACGRASINGYALLIFDSFTFLYQIKNDKNGVPLEQDISVLYDNKKLKELEKLTEQVDSTEGKDYLHEVQKDWQQTRIKNELNEWDFPMRRYLDTPTYYFKNKEVGNIAIDAKYILEDKNK